MNEVAINEADNENEFTSRFTSNRKSILLMHAYFKKKKKKKNYSKISHTN